MRQRSLRRLKLAEVSKSLEKAFAKPSLIPPKLKAVDGRIVAVEPRAKQLVH